MKQATGHGHSNYRHMLEKLKVRSRSAVIFHTAEGGMVMDWLPPYRKQEPEFSQVVVSRLMQLVGAVATEERSLVR